MYGRTGDHPLPEPILGHSDYQADPAFARERTALLDRLPLPADALPDALPADALPADALSAVPTQRGGGPDDGDGQGASGRSSG